MIGIRDKIILNHKNGNSIVKDVLEGKFLMTVKRTKNKAIIFNNIPGGKMGVFIEN